MKFACLEKHLFEAFRVLSQLFRKNSPDTVLSSVRLSATDKGVMLQCSNLTTTVNLAVPFSRTEVPGEAVLPGPAMFDALKSHYPLSVGDAGEIQFSLEGGKLIARFPDDFEYSFSVWNPEEFPYFLSPPEKPLFSLPSGQFRQILEFLVMPFPEFIDTVFWTVDREVLSLFLYTDRFLALYQNKCLPKPVLRTQAAVPSDFVFLCYAFPFRNNPLQFFITDTDFIISDGDNYVATAVQDEPCPDYAALIPPDKICTIDLKKEAVASFFNQIQHLMEKEPEAATCRLEFTANSCACIFEKKHMTAHIRFPVAYDGAPFQVTFDALLLLPVFRAIPEEAFSFHFTNRGVRVQSNKLYLYLLKPLSQTALTEVNP
jgi:DNA polymerase III sliding clamp (beta) subunit (PCNA family)